MKILVYGINFAPELTGIGKYTGEMVEWLVAQGHQVRVVAAPPYYPAWQVAAGYQNRYAMQRWKGATVWRCPLWVPSKPGGLKRILHLASFALSSLPVLLRQIPWRPDVVWMAAPAFVCAPGAALTAKLTGAASWIHVQDFEVDVAFDTGLLKGRHLRHLALSLESWVLGRFSKASSISGKMLEKLREKRVAPERISTFVNWVDTDFIRPQPKASCDALRSELGITPDTVVALYSGTLGAKAGLGILPQAAEALARHCPQLLLLVCGEGVMKSTLEAAALQHPNLRVMPLQAYDRFTTLMSLADIHLLPQEPGVADLVMPSKLGAMLASGRPVVATVEAGTELHGVLQGCGLTTPPGDANSLAQALRQLAENAPQRARMGEAARAWAEAKLAKSAVLQDFQSQLLTLCRTAR